MQLVLIPIRTPNVTQQEVDESLSELARLVNTLGFLVVGSKTQRQPSTKLSFNVRRSQRCLIIALCGRCFRRKFCFPTRRG